MKYNHIKRFMSMALLLTFMAPSCLAEIYSQSPMEDFTQISASVKLTDENDKITLSLRESDVKQVLRMFADKAGLNVVFHDSVSGKVTLDLVDMPINEAFSLVLQVAGLNYYTQNNTLIVLSKDSPDNASFSKQEMMVFPVNYVDASRIAQFLNKNVFGMKKAGLSSVDAATVNAATNEIIVFGMKSDADIVKKVIAQLDREPISKTFKVNHTTPAEMANMICDVLLPSRGSKPKNSKNSEGGFMTGGAASLEDGASGGSEGSVLKLGEGIVACSIDASNFKSSTSPFDVQNLSVTYFPQRGTVMLTGGSAAQQEMVESFVKRNDIKQPQAYLEVSIIQLNEEGSKSLQNTWALNTEAWSFVFDAEKGTSATRESGPGTKYVPVQGVDDKGEIITKMIPRSSNTYLSWHISYLIQSKKARLLANPKLMITSGQESVIDLTQDYIEKVTSEYMQSTASGTGATGSVQKTYTIGKDKGIKVTLTPFISPDGYVTLNIKPEYATDYDEVIDPNTKDIQATLLSRSNLDLKNIRIKDGETLALGGLIQEQESKSVAKVPVLGDIPVIGTIFRTTSTSKVKSELLFLITPIIINDGEDSVADNL